MPKSSLILTAVSMIALTACQAAPQSGEQSMPKNPVPLVEQAPVDGDRLSQLESRVESLETQVTQAQPTLKKVEAMETHFKALSLELDRISETYKDQPVVAVAAPVAAPASKAEIKPEAQITEMPKAKPTATAKKETAKPQPKKTESSVAAVTSVRIGEQKGEITRIVLDTTKAAELHYDLDNGEGLLVVDLPGNKWDAVKQMTLKNSPMVKSFTGTSDENGAHLILQLKQTAKVATTARLNPSGAYGHRVYLDLVPSK
ncbi:MAG TPA: hypothetical protein PKI93_00860 [Alphaproteobacteria bacterium]|nr:hypothetical protein [Alphaproteobacteria bacterium]